MLIKYLLFLTIALGLAGIYAMMELGRANQRIKELNKCLNCEIEVCSQRVEVTKSKLSREVALNRLFTELLFDLLHTNSKHSLRWKFQMLREMETILRQGNLLQDDKLYDLVYNKLLQASTDDRNAVYERLVKVVDDYFLIDTEEAAPLLDMMKDLIEGSVVVEKNEKWLNQCVDKYVAAVKAIHDSFEVLDTDPLGKLPNVEDARVLAEEDGPMTREQMLERLIALAEETTITTIEESPADEATDPITNPPVEGDIIMVEEVSA